MSTTADGVTISSATIRRIGLVVAGLIAVVLLVVAVGYILSQLRRSDPIASAINGQQYQAVFLTNGSVYFGTMTAPGDDIYYLRHVYYLAQAAPSKTGQPLQRTLVKLTADIHGPQDLMIINRSQILYVENLRPNGKAAQLLRAGGAP